MRALKSMTSSVRRFALLGLLVPAVAVAGCGGGSEGETGTEAGTQSAGSGLTPVTLATIPGGATMQLAMGQKMGFFRDEGIDLTIDYQLAPTVYTASVLSNKIQLATLGWGGFLSAASNGVPVVAIANLTTMGWPAGNGQEARPDDTQFVALESSGIKTPADFAGKTIALPTLASQSEAEVRHLAQENGISEDDIKLVQVDFQSMAAALRSGRVDVALLTEPFLAQLREQTPITLVSGEGEVYASALKPGSAMPRIAVIASKTWVTDNKETADAVRRALDRTTEWAASHPDEIADALAANLKLSPELAETVIPSTYSSKVDFDALSQYVAIARELGVLQKDVDPRTVTILE